MTRWIIWAELWQDNQEKKMWINKILKKIVLTTHILKYYEYVLKCKTVDKMDIFVEIHKIQKLSHEETFHRY